MIIHWNRKMIMNRIRKTIKEIILVYYLVMFFFYYIYDNSEIYNDKTNKSSFFVSFFLIHKNNYREFIQIFQINYYQVKNSYLLNHDVNNLKYFYYP